MLTKLDADGRNITTTPTSPTEIAIQLRHPTRSPSSNAASAVTMSGSARKIEYALASDKVRTE